MEHRLSSFHNCHIKSSTKGRPREPFTLHWMHINEARSSRIVFEANSQVRCKKKRHSIEHWKYWRWVNFTKAQCWGSVLLSVIRSKHQNQAETCSSWAVMGDSVTDCNGSTVSLLYSTASLSHTHSRALLSSSCPPRALAPSLLPQDTHSCCT